MAREKIALVLGGGGARGAYEAGVWQALRELGVKIDIVTGTSVGAINGAMVAQGEFELTMRLWGETETSMVFDLDIEKNAKKTRKVQLELKGMNIDEILAYAKEIVVGGAQNTGLHQLLDRYIDEEKLRNSPVEYGLVTVELPSFEPHFLLAEEIPTGMLKEYIMASASCFPAVKTYEIDKKQYIDGGYADNLPVEMALKLGATRIIAVDLEAVGVVRKDMLKKAEDETDFTLIRSSWDLGNFLVFHGANALHIIRLGYLDTMKAFGVFSGNYYTFPKGEFDKKTTKEADMACKIFELDPTIIYQRSSLDTSLRAAIEKHSAEMKKELKLTKSTVLKEFALEAIALFSNKISRKSLVLSIADSFKNKAADDNLFLTRHANKMFRDEILAASYIAKRLQMDD